VTFAEKQARALLERYTEKWAKQLEGVEDAESGETPAWIKHGMALIRRAEVRNPLYTPIVSVQPMTGPVGGMAFYQPVYPKWEPSAVDRLAALAEPNGELAQRISDYDGRQALLRNL